MNLDVKNPAECLGNIFALIQPAAVVTNSKFKAVIEPIAAANNAVVINVEEVNAEAPVQGNHTILRDRIGTHRYRLP